MIINGKYNEAKVFTDYLDPVTRDQIENYLSMDYIAGEKIRIMPDTHAGKGCVVGLTQTFSDKVCPNIVGVDIGCGMLTVKLGKDPLNLKEIDEIIKQHIPSGHQVRRNVEVPFHEELEQMKMTDHLKNMDRLEKSIGSLGGGNHFIEIGEDEKGVKYLIIHTGSRNLGTQVASYYQKVAIAETGDRYPNDLAYLEGDSLEDYLHDMKIAQQFARINREIIATIILEQAFGKSLPAYEYFETIHNYIDLENNFIRKGAISAQKQERVLIPFNMRDGALICRGLGNKDWNYSAPHGAGRVLSRTQARKQLSLKEFKKQMRNVYTTSVAKSTLDEAPDAYKDARDIMAMIGPTVEIEKVLTPVYNFKAK